MSRKIIILIIVLFLTTTSLFALSLLKNSRAPALPVVSPTPIQIVPNPRKEQSRLSYVVPGKTNGDDVEKLLGTPSGQSNRGGLTELNFPTNQNNFNNTVVLKQNLTYYTVENVFDDSTYGTTQDFISKFGASYTKLFDTRGGYDWYIFLDQGFGIETNGTQITRLMRFVPQNLASFLSGPGLDMGLSQTQVPPNEGIIPAP